MKFQTTAQLSDYLQIYGTENNFILFKDGSIGFGLQITPKDIFSSSDHEINSTLEKATQFLGGLPEGLTVQFVQKVHGSNDTVLSQHQNLVHPDSSRIAQKLTSIRLKRLEHFSHQRLVPNLSLQVFFRTKSESLVKSGLSFFSDSKAAQAFESDLKHKLEKLTQLKTEMIEKLKALDVEPIALTSDQIIEGLYREWNPNRTAKLDSYDPEDICPYILFNDVGVSEKGFLIGNTHYRVISLKLLPEQTFCGMSSILNKLPFDSTLSLTFCAPSQIKEIESLQSQRRMTYSLLHKKGVSDIESGAKYKDLESVLESLLAKGEKIFRVSLQVILKSENEEELESQVSHTLGLLREMSGCEGMMETLASFNIFSDSTHPNAFLGERVLRMKTSNLKDFIPFFGNWKGHSVPSILLRNRSGGLLSFNPFDDCGNLVNSNQLISGASGSGKSFLTNILVLQALKENAQVYFIDIGGSYEKLVKNLSGQYIKLDLDENLSLNPFDLAPGESTPSQSTVKFLAGLIELMVKEEKDERLSRFLLSEIEKGIQEVYQNFDSPRLTHLKEVLEKNGNEEVRKVASILNSWCGESPYGLMLDQPTRIQLNQSLVAFDLKGIESYKDLQKIFLYIISDFIWRSAQKDRFIKKWIIFDECWQLLKDEAACRLIESIFRTIRKYYGSAIAISQDLVDFSKSEISNAILPNCSIKWVLMQNLNQPKLLEDLLGLCENEISAIQSLRQETGVYSEAFLIAGKSNHTVAVIESTPIELWISTTRPKDLEMIKNYQEANPEKSNWECITYLATTHPHGSG